jgi:hypothetical protein
MHRPNGEPVSPEEVVTATPEQLERARASERFIFKPLFVPTGPLAPAWLRRLIDRDWVPDPTPPYAHPPRD